MKTYEIIILGSGFTSFGLASREQSSLIIENSECLDTSFYLPLKSYNYRPFTPSANGAKRLGEIFSELNLFDGKKQNVNGFDVALCNYANEINANVLLRTTVLSAHKVNGYYEVTVQNNGGTKTYKAKKVIDTRSEKLNPKYTVLFTGSEVEKQEVEKAFSVKANNAFYDGWYALTFDASGYHINDVTVYVYNVWNNFSLKAKILYMPPKFSYSSTNRFCDDYYDNPIKAFEAGEVQL